MNASLRACAIYARADQAWQAIDKPYGLAKSDHDVESKWSPNEPVRRALGWA